MVDKLKSKQLLLSSLAVAVALNSGLSAGADESQGWALEEVVVTAQKRSESLQDVPVAVSAFSGEDLGNAGIGGTKALQMVTPSLVANNTGANAQFYIRGIGSRISFLGLEPSTAVYIDDQYISRPSGGLFDFADVERVEILKGPQGTLYGRNATAGAVRVISRNPAEEFEGELKATLGNYNNTGVSGTVSIPVTDSFRTRLSAMVRNHDGYADNQAAVGRSEIDDQDEQAYRLKAVWDINETTTASLRVDHVKKTDLNGADLVDLSPSVVQGGSIVSGSAAEAAGASNSADAGKVYTSIEEPSDVEMLNAQVRVDFDLDGVDFASITTSSKLSVESNTDADASELRFLDAWTTEESDTYTQEFQFLSDSEGPLEWILGLYYFQQEGDAEIKADIRDRAPVILSLGEQNADITAWSVYGQATYELSDQWAVTLGGRWNEEEKKIANDTGATEFVDSEEWSEFTPKATVEYSLDNGLLYLSYARGFKSGGYNYPYKGETPLEPEILDMLELGYKADLLDDRLRLNAAAYYYDYQDLQVTRAASASGGTPTLTTENAGTAEVLGLEVDLTWLMSENLTLIAGVNMMESEYDDFEDASAKVFRLDSGTPGTGNAVFNANGESLLRAPDLAAFVTLNYDVQLAEATLPLSITYAYKSEYDFDFISEQGSPVADGLTQEAYGLLNARMGYQPASADWSVSVWGSNLTDEEYFDDLVANAVGLRGSYGAPRTFGVDLSYSF